MTSNTSGVEKIFSLTEYLTERKIHIEKTLEAALPPAGAGHPVLREAMRYSLLGAGKRFRPILLLASCEACGGDWENAIDAACAVEFVHAYSLVHDDLPAMDDAALRRGRDSCHRKYGEATAILVGDALLTEAWGLLARWGAAAPGRAEVSAGMIHELARGAGIEGMVSGQAYDIEKAGPADIQALDELHRLKTGALIRAAVRMGAIAAGADDGSLDKLTRYAQALGLAFQVVDDILDVEGGDTGKDSGADAALGKRTYPVMVGIECARDKAQALVEEANAALDGLPGPIEPLAAIAQYAVDREK